MVATKEPASFVAGDTLKFTRELPDYRPGDGWVLSYALVNDSHQTTLVGTDNGDGLHLIEVSAATTASFAPGDYRWQAFVERQAERYTVDSGRIVITANFADVAGLDARAHCEKVLAAIEATLERKATKDQQSYSVSFGDGAASRAVSRLTFGELIEARKIYRQELTRLKKQERLAKGLPGRSTIHIRMPV